MTVTRVTLFSTKNYNTIHNTTQHYSPTDTIPPQNNAEITIKNVKKLVPWGTDGRLSLSDLDLDLGSGHTAYRRASLIDLYLHTKFH